MFDSDLTLKYPAISDLERKARRRIPHFGWEYLDSGTGIEDSLTRNRSEFSRVTLTPRFMRGELDPVLKTSLFEREYASPFGMAPVGLTGLMWPRAELILARAAKAHGIPYSLSTVATETPEDVGALAQDMGWFQLYPPRDPAVREDILKRAADSGFTTLLVTADVPWPSQRERQKRAEVSVPPKRTIKTYLRAAIRPAWSVGTLQNGLPRFRALEPYASSSDMAKVSVFLTENFGGTLSWEYLREVRDLWPGEILVKGILGVDDARQCVEQGMDGIVVSNHGARQFDGAPSSIEVLPEIVNAVGKDTTIVLDSGVRGGLDICRALALGADFVLLGRAFIYAVAAFGERGANHAVKLLQEDMRSCMANLGCETLEELKACVRTTQ